MDENIFGKIDDGLSTIEEKLSAKEYLTYEMLQKEMKEVLEPLTENSFLRQSFETVDEKILNMNGTSAFSPIDEKAVGVYKEVCNLGEPFQEISSLIESVYPGIGRAEQILEKGKKTFKDNYIGKNIKTVEERLGTVEEQVVNRDFTNFEEVQNSVRNALAHLVHECDGCYSISTDSQSNSGVYSDTFGFGNVEAEERFIEKHREVCGLGEPYKKAAFLTRVIDFGPVRKAEQILRKARREY